MKQRWEGMKQPARREVGILYPRNVQGLNVLLPAAHEKAKTMKTNSSDVIRSGECVCATISAPCRICGRRPALHCPATQTGAYCARHCPACSATAALDVEAVVWCADRSGE